MPSYPPKSKSVQKGDSTTQAFHQKQKHVPAFSSSNGRCFICRSLFVENPSFIHIILLHIRKHVKTLALATLFASPVVLTSIMNNARQQLDRLFAVDAGASVVFGLLSLLAPHGFLTKLGGGSYNHSVHETLRSVVFVCPSSEIG